ncbi:MAG TPA: HEAT repeat domain-containing protein [Pyrinomonadaceae bacterium]|jgi:HEAT repeat protein
MASRRTHTLHVARVPLYLCATLSLLLPTSAQSPHTGDEQRARALITRLKASTPSERGVAAYEPSQIGPAAEAVPELIEQLRDEAPYVRGNAAAALVKIGPAAVPELAAALRSTHVGVRGGAAYVLGRIEPAAVEATPALIEQLSDENAYVRGNVADALVQIGPQPQTVQLLIEALNSQTQPNVDVRGGAAYVLGRIGPEAEGAVSALTKALEDREVYVRASAADALGRIRLGAEAAIQKLIKALHDESGEVRSGAAYALGQIGPAAKDAIKDLIELLKDQHEHVRASAALALVGIGRPAVRALALKVKEQDQDVGVSGGAASVLGQIGAEDDEAVQALSEALGHREDKRKQAAYVRRQAASALGRIGPAAKAAVPALVEALRQDTDKDVRVRAASAISSVFMALSRAQTAEERDALAGALRAVEQSSDPEVRKHADLLRQKLEELGQPWWAWLWALALEHLGYASVFILVLVLLSVWLILLAARPAALLRGELKFVSYTARPGWDKVRGPLRFIQSVIAFERIPRVLDAWIEKYVIGHARAVFKEKETVSEREFHFVPGVKGKASIRDFIPDDTRRKFSGERARLVICGEGGSGKTSLACQLGTAATDEKEHDRLCQEHLMLPVLIETMKEDDGSFLNEIKAQVNEFIPNETLSDEMIINLLRLRRILVIIDSFSELSAKAQEQIRDSIDALPVNACIITARTEEALRERDRAVINQGLVGGSKLTEFMEKYLEHRRETGLFDGVERLAACLLLTQIVGDKDFPALLAKFYAELLIASKKGNFKYDPPKNIPDLMLKYLNYINRKRGDNEPDDGAVQRATMLIAWECLRERYRPAPAERSAVLSALGGEEKVAANTIAHLRKLQIIKPPGHDETWISFKFDPVAEYLAGIYLVHKYGAKKDDWRAFFDYADRQGFRTADIMEFLLAVRDCCLTVGADGKVPGFVAAELTSRVVEQLGKNLRGETEQAREAVRRLGALGPDAKGAAAALLAAAARAGSEKDREDAVSALVKLGLEVNDPVLEQALTDKDTAVRECAEFVIDKIRSRPKGGFAQQPKP